MPKAEFRLANGLNFDIRTSHFAPAPARSQPIGRGLRTGQLIRRSGRFSYTAAVKKMWVALSILAVAALLLLVGCQVTRAGYESALYKVVQSDGKFELRDYPALAVVETPMANPDGSDGSFRRLFRFITGANEEKQKIAMTTPVFMSGGSTNLTMAFVLPGKLKQASVPKPADGALTVRELPAGRFAVLRFSGGRNAKHEAETLVRLQSWLERERLTAVSGPVYGYFDPPWTPTFLRRNEVMLRTEGENTK
ncbi:MAG: hypothetical protein RL514_4721 [Verrucomicrobiota bacterium]|jgi:hypothetical protein